MASQPPAHMENKEIAKDATSESKYAASVNIARLLALMPPTTSTKTTQSATAIKSLRIEADRSLASLELDPASENPQAAFPQSLLPPLHLSLVGTSTLISIIRLP